MLTIAKFWIKKLVIKDWIQVKKEITHLEEEQALKISTLLNKKYFPSHRKMNASLKENIDQSKKIKVSKI